MAELVIRTPDVAAALGVQAPTVNTWLSKRYITNLDSQSVPVLAGQTRGFSLADFDALALVHAMSLADIFDKTLGALLILFARDYARGRRDNRMFTWTGADKAIPTDPDEPADIKLVLNVPAIIERARSNLRRVRPDLDI